MTQLPRRFAITCLGVMLSGSLTGCYAWNRQPVPVTDPPAFHQYQVWSHGSVMVLQKVHLEHDTLYGIPADASRDCGTCTLAIPMSRVDSLRTGTTAHVGTAVIGIGAGVAAFFLMMSAALSGWND